MSLPNHMAITFNMVSKPLTIFANVLSLVDLKSVPGLINLRVALNAINARRLPLALLDFSLVRPLMTTTIVNNSLFRSLFKKQKLTGNNFMEWYRNLRIVLSTEDTLLFLEQPIPVLLVPPQGQANPPDVTEHELLQTVREFHACKQEEGHLILVSLRKEYDGFVQNYNMHSMGKTVNELHAMLKLHEQTFPPKEVAPALHAIRAGRIRKNQKKKSHKAAKGNQGKGKAKMGYAPVQAPPFSPKPKNPPTPKKDNPAKDAICHQCGIFTIEIYYFPSTSWVYDTGCGTHICIATQGLRGSRELKPRALSLYVGDGHRAAVEAIGDYHLCLPSGLVLILHNCHYAPSITRGIISVSHLYKDGFVNRFENDNSNFVIYAVPRDDIYEIVMSFSNTNESSMYTVTNKRSKLNLDSALLWHCRLGHINKKRIDKLQHDGIFNSTDIKSFEKCVACMSVFQKEVENQLRKTIKSLRSDRGGKYMSQEFLDHLKDHGIIAHRTPPYTPQHNGVSERRNRTLLDMVRSMMSQATLPKSF
ncbi:zinc finger, CCHC-type containing protein [Tanacetum coccineum]